MLGGDRGDAPTLLIVFAVTLLAFFGAVHATLVLHGRSVVSAAAQDGLSAAQLESGTNTDGQNAAVATLGLSPGLRNQSVNVVRTTTGAGHCDQIRVTVTAEVETPLVEMLNVVSAEVTGPCERFYSEPERR
jgi:Flp pilus assembly protein TadG